MDKLSLKKKDSNLLKVNFKKSLEDPKFQELISNIDLPNDILMKYTSKLRDASIENNNCLNCKSYLSCKNTMKGYCFKPVIYNNSLTFSYIKCDFKCKIILKAVSLDLANL